MDNKIVVEFIPATKWYRRAMWKLTKAYNSHNGEITVPAGFVSDGASIPFFVRPWFSPTGKYFGAAIVHDYVLVSTHEWKNANHQFWKELNALGINTWRKNILLGAVKIYYRFLKLVGKD